MPESRGQVVIVTGASGNLGRAVARTFLRAGAHLVLIDREPARLERGSPELAASDDHQLAVSVDVNDPEAVRSVVETTVRRLGRLDVLVHTVGGYAAGAPVHETPVAVWDDMWRLNARSAYVVCQAAVPTMRQQGEGRIIMIAARPGLAGRAQMAAYSAAKAAVIRLTESLSAELRADGINVNCIVPGTIDTPQNRRDMPGADPGHWVAPESLADVIRFLASDAARDIHGAALPVYGRS